MTSVFDAAGGTEFFRRLAHAWHERCLADPVVAHAFSHGFHPDHSDRLAAYWAECCGGPPTFSTTIADESTVLRLHAGNGEHEDMDRRAEAAFDAALVDVGLAPDDTVATSLAAYFRWSNARMAAHPRSPDDVPDGMPMPRWSFDGPVGP